MTCAICNHRKRVEIERACLLRSYGDNEITLSEIAKEYKVDLKALQVHVLMHIPLAESNSTAVESNTSIASEIKRREADILRQVMEDSYITFKNVGDKINGIVSQHTTKEPTMQQLTKSVTDLYLGTSQSIRDTAEKLMKMNLLVNGQKDEGMQSLANLVSVLRGDKTE